MVSPDSAVLLRTRRDDGFLKQKNFYIKGRAKVWKVSDEIIFRDIAVDDETRSDMIPS